MKINWTQKLTSRKFLAAVTGFVTALLIAFAVPQSEITQIVGIITAGFTLIAYIIGEGLVDAAGASAAMAAKNTAADVQTGSVTETAKPATAPDVKTAADQATAATVPPVPETDAL